MRHEQNPAPGPDNDPVDPDVVPEGAPRGGVTVPDANDTGTTTPPISGWGETVPEAVEDERRED